MKESNKIISNTIILYVQMVLSAGIALFSTRFLLQALGVDDFGLFNLISGVIVMLSFLNVAMAGATQRFISFAIGKGNNDEVNKVFYNSAVLHFAIALVVLLFLGLIGNVLVDFVLTIPEKKITVASFLIACLSVSAFASIISVPYQAVLNAHEKMNIIASVAFLESVSKFVIACLLLTYNGDRLKLYAVLMMCIPILSFLIMRTFCRQQYQETHYKICKIKDSAFLKNMLKYASWNLMGTIANICRNQGISVVLNMYNGVSINAAYGVANQVNGQMGYLSSSIIRAVRPVIIKSQGAGDKENAIKLAVSCCKFTFVLVAMFAIPLIVKMPYILALWLGTVPDYTIIFCRLILVVMLVNQMTPGLFIAIEGTGNIKLIQTVISIAHISIIPIGMILFHFGFPPQTIIVLMIIEEILALVMRVCIVDKLIGLNQKVFYFKTIIPMLLISWASIGGCFIIDSTISNELTSFIMMVIISVLVYFVISFWLMLESYEKELIIQKFVWIKQKIK